MSRVMPESAGITRGGCLEILRRGRGIGKYKIMDCRKGGVIGAGAYDGDPVFAPCSDNCPGFEYYEYTDKHPLSVEYEGVLRLRCMGAKYFISYDERKEKD